MCKTVLVLLSTYNGEKYLAEQLDTILNQTKNMDFSNIDMNSMKDMFRNFNKNI